MASLRTVVSVFCFLAALAIATAGAATGQEAPTTPLTVSKSGYFTSNINGALPPVLVKEIPPAPVCLVTPQLCSPEVDALKVALSLNDGVPLPAIPDFLVPQPVPPGELPVGMIGGQTRYTSAVQFQLPNIAAKSVVNKFDLVIKDGALAFSIQSPAFRQAILSVLSQYPEQQPEVIDTFVADVTEQNTALGDFTPTGIEACMVTKQWEAGENQDPANRPTTDCIVGGVGKHDDTAGTWTFDISGIVQSWLDGKPNAGISLSPLGAQNVAYGDPDPSTNWTITLAGEGEGALAARFDVGPPLVEEAFDVGSDVAGESLEAAGDVLTDTGAIDSSGSVSTPSQEGSAAPRKVRLASGADTPWWIWLAFPFILAGCVALSQALDAVPDLATRRPGALTRLTADMEDKTRP